MGVYNNQGTSEDNLLDFNLTFVRPNKKSRLRNCGARPKERGRKNLKTNGDGEGKGVGTFQYENA